MDWTIETVYYPAAICLWLTGYFVARFNSFNLIIAEVAPAHAKGAWKSYGLAVPFILRLLSWVFIFSSIMLLYFTETIGLSFEDSIMTATALVFFSSLLAYRRAWRAFTKKYPDALDCYNFKKQFERKLKE